MSRAVSVLRTSIVDSGLGMEVLKVVMGRSTRPENGVGDTETGESVDRKRVGRAETSTSSAGWGSWGAVGDERDEDRMDVGDRDAAEDMNVAVESDDGKVGNGLGEDRRVLSAALAAVCNIVNDFSPLRPVSTSLLHFPITYFRHNPLQIVDV